MISLTLSHPYCVPGTGRTVSTLYGTGGDEGDDSVRDIDETGITVATLQRL